MHEKLGIKTGDCSVTVGQALTEFGSEESFELAARRFTEHYGFYVERNWWNRKSRRKSSLSRRIYSQNFEENSR